MNKHIFSTRFIFLASAILVVAISRLFPHPWNFTPVAAMALFGGVTFSDKKFAFLVPLTVMFISDCLLELVTGWGFHNTMGYVYFSFILTTMIGIYVKKNPTVFSVGIAALVCSVLFFLITNFGVWAASGYAGGAAGLGATYTLGLPFFARTLAGDLFYNGILFGSLYFAQRRFPALVKA